MDHLLRGLDADKAVRVVTEDIEALADEQGGTEVRCSYCGDAYSLSEPELRGLAAQLREQMS